MFVVVERHHDQQFERIEEIGIFVHNNNNSNNNGNNNNNGDRNDEGEKEKSKARVTNELLLKFASILRNVKGRRCFVRMFQISVVEGVRWRAGRL